MMLSFLSASTWHVQRRQLFAILYLCTISVPASASSGQQNCSHPIRSPLIVTQQCSASLELSRCNGVLWTYDPICFELQTGGNEFQETFCLYTSNTYAEGRGISLISTPAVAASITIISPPPISDEGHQLRCEARQTEDRGIGLFATQPLPAGTVYMRQAPILIVARDVMHNLPIYRLHRLFEIAVHQLPSHTQDLYVALTHNNVDPLVPSIFKINSMGLPLGNNTGHLSVIPEAARINHACRPNSLYRFNEETLILDVVALRDVEEGEEMTFAYGFAFFPHSQRQEALQRNWSFNCTCALCAASEQERNASDVRLARIVEIQNNLPTALSRAAELLAWLPELIELLETENLLKDLPKYEELFAYTWAAVENEEKAKYWARRAKRGWAVVAGKGSWEVKRMEWLEQDVRGHGIWGAGLVDLDD